MIDTDVSLQKSAKNVTATEYTLEKQMRDDELLHVLVLSALIFGVFFLGVEIGKTMFSQCGILSPLP
jgi:hypothetical protein